MSCSVGFLPSQICIPHTHACASVMRCSMFMQCLKLLVERSFYAERFVKWNGYGHRQSEGGVCTEDGEIHTKNSGTKRNIP